MRNEINWKAIDLNLLVAFSYLYQFRSVSVAAEQSYVSQSAMSHSLARLRQLLDDRLFERQGHIMEPSEFAHRIAPTVESLLNTISSELLSKTAFSAAEYRGICRIGLTDYAEFIYAPHIYDRIHQQAPFAQVSFLNVNRSNYQKMTEQEKLDLVIGSIPEPDEQFESQPLYTEQHVCLFDPQFVAPEEITDIARFAKIEQALVSADGALATNVDRELALQHLSRQVTVASRNFLTIRRLLSQRRLVAIVPRLMALAPVFSDHLAMSPPPVPVADFDIAMLWHKTRASDEKSVWLRQVVQSVIGSNGMN